ncbi:hypothetical protein [Methylophaga pinxianii]|uniref:hypothetical protein n=1 Tax=Methylophaga pinxianii TaxID=2881052 RepID=UPI001CF3714A|nr:hypothetical protein [Methylophaga pinxianii]MCB2427500.1 hypothetical protein [Methylophaga pinxianii]UPH47126.1 hypothetical protein LGT42_009660 [Methylophaga pinxianii]
MNYHRSQVAAVVLLLVSVGLALLPFESSAGTQLSQMLKVTLTVYALARGLNAVISVAQGTELSIEPMGVGLTLTPGQILDPLNDLIEQFSGVLLMASASLGIQKILLSMGDIALVRWGLAGFAVIVLLLMLWQKLPDRWSSRLFNMVLILTLLRLAIPVTILASNQLQLWLDHDRQEAITVLQATQQEVAAIQPNGDESQSRWYQGLKENLDIKTRLQTIQQKAEQGINAAIYLLAEFVLIMLILPIGFLFVAWRLIGKITRQ